MSRYTDAQIAEFKKMGYDINSKGELVKETRLQKITRTSVDNQTINSLKVSRGTLEEKQYGDRKSSTGYVQKGTRVKEEYTDEQRKIRGLVTTRKKGISYMLLKDDTKVCRCCQERLHKSHYSVTLSRKDLLSPICKECDNTRGKTFRDETGL